MSTAEEGTDYQDLLKQYKGVALTPKKRRAIDGLVQALIDADPKKLSAKAKKQLLAEVLLRTAKQIDKVKEIQSLRSPNIRRAILIRDKYQCVFCGKRVNIVTVELDHDIPWARGGTDHPANLQASCRACNRAKSDLTSAEFRMQMSTGWTLTFSDLARHGMKRRSISEDTVRAVLLRGVHDRPAGKGKLIREAAVNTRRVAVKYRVKDYRLEDGEVFVVDTYVLANKRP